MLPQIASIRRSICKRCKVQCEPYLAGEIDHNDPSVTCPIKKWGHAEGGRPPAETTPKLDRAAVLIILGRKAWGWLHIEAKEGRLTEDRINCKFIPMIPSYGCTCKKEFREIIKAIPFDLENQFAVTAAWHNAVNQKLGKPVLSLEEAVSIWAS
jgi:hypothetical protein